LPNVIKINPYNFELYCFKLGVFFLRHSVYTGRLVHCRLVNVTKVQLPH